MIYDDLLQAQIFSNNTITDLLSKDITVPTAPALYNDLVVPEDLGKEASTINFYGITPNTESYGEETFTVNCRTPGHVSSVILAQTVRNELHRANNSDNNTLFVCDIQQTLPPFDQTDNYNTVVNVKLTTRVQR